MDRNITLPQLWPQTVSAEYLLELCAGGTKINVPPLETRSYRDPHGTEVTVQEYAVDFSDTAACTEIRVRLLLANSEPGYHYLNPQFTVSAPALCGEFCQRMEDSSRGWFRKLDQVIRASGRKADYKRASKREKALGYTGVIVIDGVESGDASLVLRQYAKNRRREARKAGRKTNCRVPKLRQP